MTVEAKEKTKNINHSTWRPKHIKGLSSLYRKKIEELPKITKL
jgi:hypothetical protein